MALKKRRKQAIRAGARERGTPFELAAANVVRLLDPDAAVSHNEQLEDRIGHARQFDVVVRGTLGGRQILGVVECKDHTRRIGPGPIEAFATKAADVRANLTMFASARGFTRRAIEKARHHGIGTVSLLPNDAFDPGISVGLRWFVEVYRWAENILHVGWKNPQNAITGFEPREIKWAGLPIVDWWGRQLSTTYAKRTEPGWVSATVVFSKPRLLTFGATRRAVAAVAFRSRLERTVKTKSVQLRGIGMLNWDSGTLTTPAGAPLTVRLTPQLAMSFAKGSPPRRPVGSSGAQAPAESAFKHLGPGETASFSTGGADLSDWDDFEGEIPPSGRRNLGLGLTMRDYPVEPTARVPDLGTL